MKSFFERYSFYSFRMLIDQVAIAIFGLVLSMATNKFPTLRLICTIGAILFYLFLLYLVGWEIGSKDRMSADLGKITYRPVTGLLVSLLANSINILFALFVTCGLVLNVYVLGRIGAVGALLGEGMYTGLLALKIGETPLNEFWFMYFIIILPALLISTVSYILGYHNVMFTGLMKPQYPASDRPGKKDKENENREGKQ
ncbi:MAG: hypothetical protein IJR83_00320 [Clostridia bacterium]|nr:hypothetical protein [Clostridia bacterium]